MRNINAFLKYKFLLLGKPLKAISFETGLDMGYISRILNNKLPLPKSRNFNKLCRSLNINPNLLNIENDPLYSLFDEFMETVYYVRVEERASLYQEIVSLEKRVEDTPLIILVLLAEFIYKSCLHQFDDKFHSSLHKLLPIENSLDDYEHKLFLVYYANYLKQKRLFKESNESLNKAKAIKTKNENLDMMTIYYDLQINKENLSYERIQTFYECFDLYKKTNNVILFINLRIIFTGYLLEVGFIEDALKNDLEIYQEFYLAGKITKNMPIILNNIAWCYLLLKDYNHALVYYLKNMEYDQDTEVYFSIAWCYYCMDNYSEARKYIQLGKSSLNRLDIYYLLLEWLESMIQKKHSKKSYHILMKICKEYEDQLSSYERNLVYIELLNYYKANQMYEEYIEMSEKLLKKSVISPVCME